jgi:FPC/CPF motif-containing protein YcgG
LRESARLLECIPGREATIAQLLAVVGDFARFNSASELAKVLAHFRVESLTQLSSNAASRAITSLQSERRAA